MFWIFDHISVAMKNVQQDAVKEVTKTTTPKIKFSIQEVSNVLIKEFCKYFSRYRAKHMYKNINLKGITQWWTLVELCHDILTVTSIHMVRPCSTDYFS